jgi:hypothetical protein
MNSLIKSFYLNYNMVEKPPNYEKFSQLISKANGISLGGKMTREMFGNERIREVTGAKPDSTDNHEWLRSGFDSPEPYHYAPDEEKAVNATHNALIGSNGHRFLVYCPKADAPRLRHVLSEPIKEFSFSLITDNALGLDPRWSVISLRVRMKNSIYGKVRKMLEQDPQHAAHLIFDTFRQKYKHELNPEYFRKGNVKIVME